MKLARTTALSAAALIACESSAWAETYAGVHAMVGWAEASHLERIPPQPALPMSLNSDTGGVNGGAGAWLGYDFNPRYDLPISLELGGSWRYRHDLNVSFRDTGGGNPLYGLKSDVSTTDIILSGIWDVTPLRGPDSFPLQPYVGAGIGAVYAKAENYLLTPATTQASDSTDWNMAWQLQTGLKYPMSKDFSLRLDYRYINMGTISSSVLPSTSSDRFTAEIDSHDIRIGAVWHFN